MNKEAKSSLMYIVRHGRSRGNEGNLVSGSTDHPITAEGEKQAIELGNKFRNVVTFDEAYASDLSRAIRTAELIIGHNRIRIKTEIRERDFGELEGRDVKELHAVLDSWRDLPYQEQQRLRPAKNAETGEEVMSRFGKFLREAATEHRGKKILVATHGSLMYSFLIYKGIATNQEIKKIHNTAYILVESDGIDFQIIDMEGVVIEHEVKSTNN